MPRLGSGLRIPEDVRGDLCGIHGVALDRNSFIVARMIGPIHYRLGHTLMLDVRTRRFFELDVPVLNIDGLHNRCATRQDYPHRLGDSLSCATYSPLGRAVTCLQRRVRFRRQARRFLRRLLEQLPGTSDELNTRIIKYIGGVTLFPRVM